ncbi:CotH kinase family protein [candidate division KSB1 bacterium]|nr:CotH kinase family protein [candidate division KSB1 bacterium]
MYNVLKNLLVIVLFVSIQFLPFYGSAADRIYPASLHEEISDEGLLVNLVETGHSKKAFIPNDSVDINWYSRLDFNDSEWLVCENEPGGIGFDRDGDYASYISLDISGMRNTTCYIRIPFTISGDLLEALDYLVLRLRFDDGFVAYLNGRRVAAFNATSQPNWRSNAVQPHEASIFESYIISQHLDVLVPGENLLAIHGMNVDRSSPDFLILPQLIGRKSYKEYFESRLPIFDIRTDNGNGIGSATESSALFSTIGQNDDELKKISDPYEQTLSVRIVKENNSFEYPKSSYDFVTIAGDGSLQDQEILGLESNRWILHAPYSDKTLIRDALAGILARFMGKEFYQSRFCHLFVNEEYLGIYLFRKNITSAGMGISPLTPGDVSGDVLTGGYILELDRWRRDNGFVSDFAPLPNRYGEIVFRYFSPQLFVMPVEQQDYIKTYMHDFETAVSLTAFPASTEQTASLFNLSSFVDYFLLNEMSRNVYGYRANSCFIKDRDSIDPQLHIETLWDFHHAFGNNDQFGGSSVTGWTLPSLLSNDQVAQDSLQIPFWWKKLYDDPTFLKSVYERYQQLRLDYLDETDVNILFDSLYFEIVGPQVLNYERWPIIGQKIAPNSNVGITFVEDFDYLLVWFLDRLDWMDKAIEPFQTAIRAGSRGEVPDNFVVLQNFPNPFNARTVITVYVDKPAVLLISIYNVAGQLVKQTNISCTAGGIYRYVWDGLDQNQQTVADGVYYCRASRSGESRTIKMLVLK